MSKEELELSKLHYEVESLQEQLRQARQGKEKLGLEVELLRSQVGGFGTFARVAWPIVSVILSTAIALMALTFTLKQNKVEEIQKERERTQKEKEIFNVAVQQATDETKGNDVRISGMWTLNDPYFDWNNPFFQTTAHALVAALVTGTDEDNPQLANSKQAVRLTAAQILGGSVPCVPESSGHLSPAQAVSRFLFGSVENRQTSGVISQVESSLRERRLQVKDPAAIDLKLSAIRVVVQRYGACFEKADLSGFDLTNIQLRSANLADAALARADLNSADLRGDNIQGTDLSEANLVGAHLEGVLNWDGSIVTSANIKNILNAPPGFREWALDQHAVEMEPAAWTSWQAKGFPAPKDWTKWRAEGFAVRSGLPDS